MKARDAITILQQHADVLRARGVRHIALFGSTARDEARPESDIDIMIELDPEAPIDVYKYVGLKRFIAELFDGPVDVVDRDSLKPRLRDATAAEAIYAF